MRRHGRLASGMWIGGTSAMQIEMTARPCLFDPPALTSPMAFVVDQRRRSGLLWPCLTTYGLHVSSCAATPREPADGHHGKATEFSYEEGGGRRDEATRA